MIAWFRTRKQLHTRSTELEALVAKQADELVEVRRDANERVEEVQESLRLAHRAMDTQRRLRVEAETKLAQVVERLQVLRDDIRQAELYPLDTDAIQAAVRRRRERRIGSQVDAVFGVDEEAAAKRQADGDEDHL